MLETMSNRCSLQLILLLVILIVKTHADVEYSDNKLKMVHVIFRHGEKTPSSSITKFPKDPYRNHTFFPEGRGALTNGGRLSMYNFGTFLRKKYNHLLGDIYYPGVTRIRSTDSERTMMSAQLVNAGLWPPSETQQWNKNLLWIPIPYEYVPSNVDSLMFSYGCPTYQEEYERVLHSEEMQNLLKPHLKFFAYVTEHAGVNVTGPLDIFYIYHKLVEEKNCNLTLPKWTEGYFPDGEMYEVSLLQHDLAARGDLLKKIYGGPLLRDVLIDHKKLIEDSPSSESNPKMKLYSGHDSNVCSLLQTLGVWTPHIPDFSSAVIFELYLNKFTNGYGIQILYHLGRSGETIPLTLPGCTQICPIKEFTSLLSNLIPDDVDKLCQGNVKSGDNRTLFISLQNTLLCITLQIWIVLRETT